MNKKNNRGSDFRDFLNEQGILGEVEGTRNETGH